MRRLSNGQCALGFGQTRASDPFKRFKPEVAQPVRQADVTAQSYVERARKAREMLRSMDPEKVKQVIEFHKKLNFFQALALAQREGKLIVPNDVHDRILTEASGEQYLRQNYSVWTGTLIIYEAPDKKFGKNVVFSWDVNGVNYSISFKVPKQFRGLRNCALVVEHPDFEVVKIEVNPILRKFKSLLKSMTYSDYEIKLLEGANIQLIENFAKENSWHLTDNGIPVGAKVDRSIDDSRYLWRIHRAYLGPVARVYYVGNDRWRDVILEVRPSGRRKVAFVDVGRDANVSAATLRPLSEGQSGATVSKE